MKTLKVKKKWKPPAWVEEFCPSCADYVACGYPGDCAACALWRDGEDDE